ncbi:hypothetical protein GJ496_010716, partial [Pomphorhynchus laevis]
RRISRSETCLTNIKDSTSQNNIKYCELTANRDLFNDENNELIHTITDLATKLQSCTIENEELHEKIMMIEYIKEDSSASSSSITSQAENKRCSRCSKQFHIARRRNLCHLCTANRNKYVSCVFINSFPKTKAMEMLSVNCKVRVVLDAISKEMKLM